MKKRPVTPPHEALKDLLRSAGYKATPPRVALLQVVRGLKEPKSIDQIAKLMPAKNKMDKATLYRNILAFEASGFVKAIDFHRGHLCYEWNDHSDHHHVICLRCKRVNDFTGCDFSHLQSLALKQAKDFASIAEHSLELFGVCKGCAEKK